jgi:hypothetical protein
VTYTLAHIQKGQEDHIFKKMSDCISISIKIHWVPVGEKKNDTKGYQFSSRKEKINNNKKEGMEQCVARPALHIWRVVSK